MTQQRGGPDKVAELVASLRAYAEYEADQSIYPRDTKPQDWDTWKAADLIEAQSAAVRDLAEALCAVLERDAEWAPSGMKNDCNCMSLSNAAEGEYERGECPHQLARAALHTHAATVAAARRK